jgi:Zn-dependent metalloprotease
VKKNYLGGVLAAVLAASALAAAPGADAVTIHSGKSTTIDPRANARATAQRLIAERAPALKISGHDAFVAKPVVSNSGVQYAAYERTYRGLPVVGGDFVIVTNNQGAVLNTSVAQTRPVDLASITPTISAARAAATSKARFGRVDSAAKPTLVVFQKGTSHLAWRTSVAGLAKGELSRQDVLVDAKTGKVLGAREHVMEGTGNSAYSGSSVSIPTTLSGSTYSMKNPSATTMVCQDAATNATFSGTDDLWGNGVATSRETGCVDALYSAEQERLMLNSWLGRSGMDGSGGWVPIRVGLNDVNAYYDGSQVQIGHTQSGGKWIGEIDVVAHEFGHGIDDHTPGGISGNGTQEFVADTFGAMTEFYANNGTDTPDYTVGEMVNLVGSGPIRYMYNPSLAGDDNCYSSSTPNDEVHAAAGPGNHWFYLMAEGTNPTDGQPTSPTCNSTSITGIGIQKAAKIMYNAMLMKTSGASYLKYRTWTLTAAKNLYGTSTCTEFNAVKAAWNAVSVPAQTGDPTCTVSTGSVTVNNPGNKSGTVGTAISSFTVTASGGTAPYTWSATGLPAGVTIGSSTGTVSGTPTTAGTYNVTVTATPASGTAGSASFTFTVSPSGGGGCTAAQKIANPGFESGAASWTATAGVIGQNGASQPTHGGTWNAWLNGYGTSHTDSVTQSVTIPAGCTTATLSFYLHIDSAETTTTTQYDKLTVKLGTTTLATYSNLNKASGYVLKSFNVASFAGQTVTLSFSGVEDSSLQTSFVIDDTALNVG